MNINAGITNPIVITDYIPINMSHLFPAYSLYSGFLSSLEKMLIINILDINIPRGPETIPIAVAVDRSLSPNQFVASFVTGFLRKAWLLMHTIWPRYQSQMVEKEEIRRKREPRSMIEEPKVIQERRPR